jgi:hypothetical protein
LHVAGDVMFDGVIKPHYDSGWREVPPNGGDEIQLKHNLGVYPGLIQIFAKPNHKDDGPVLKDHYPDAIKMTNINGDSYSQRVAAGFGVRAITEESITLARGAHLWHGEVGQEFFNQGWIRVFMWRFGIGDMNMPT